MKKTKRITVYYQEGDVIDQVVTHIKQSKGSQSISALLTEILLTRYGPLVQEMSQCRARECAITCESWGKLIREEWGLETSSVSIRETDKLVSRDLPKDKYVEDEEEVDVAQLNLNIMNLFRDGGN
ncbi:hypothetical protein [Chroococcus sp. FPU101]|uniref:hypothetical protein n=1 Tax=Chroococcus sp. FPU101 TaxID=1974212 RepID=UPI001A905A95|nr:hypothetical protein [Chroococcus sp. FPU101]GFE68997.1 hypothetical protein CFPU101_16070 [Chroococcus sp. FPU101]